MLTLRRKAVFFVLAPALVCSFSTLAQIKTVSPPSDETETELKDLAETVAVTGYEDRVAKVIQDKLAGLHPQRDAMGNVTVTFGSGAPHRLIVTPIDEPGYVVSKIDSDGYLRVQRLPQNGLPPHFNELQNAQPMEVETRSGKLLNGIVAGLSIHLEPGRSAPPDPDDIDNMFVDVGASNADEVRRAGIDVLSPMAAERHLLPLGTTQWSGTAVGDRFGAAILLTLAHSLATSHIEGSVTLAFVVQQWAGARGLIRVLESQHPDELIYVGRPMPALSRPNATQTDAAKTTCGTEAYRAKPGSGIWICGEEQSPLERDFEKSGIALHHGAAPPLIPRGYGSAIALPERVIRVAVPLSWPLTAGETLDESDLAQLEQAIASYLGVTIPKTTPRDKAPLAYAAMPSRPTATPSPESILRTLILTYGVSEQESQTREMVKQLLPPWAHPTTDAGGNLVLHLGKANGKPGIVVMAHMDELGFRVRSILPDGSLDLENKGGGSPAFFWGHPALVHTSAGMRAGVLQLPDGYDTQSFHFPKDFRIAATMSVGAKNSEQVEALGIHVGDTVTIPKAYRSLLGTRVSARSLDDRVGCAALVHAVWTLGPAFDRGEVTFVWSTREELGLLGATEFAAEAARTGKSPGTVFAIDTFVSSDSPIESQRFADASLGKGFVIRAIDNSNITPWPQVVHLQELSDRHRIPVQYGVTGGGNDGSAFLRYGAVDVPLSWPLRYSHSPGEVIDTLDLDALSAITADVAKEW